MNYAAVLKPKQPPAPRAEDPKRLKEGWINLRDYKPPSAASKKKEATDAETLDLRLKEAAVTMRRRWDRWNADHGIDFDYDRECSCSDASSDDDRDEGGFAAAVYDDAEFDRDYQYIKKTTLVTH